MGLRGTFSAIFRFLRLVPQPRAALFRRRWGRQVKQGLELGARRVRALQSVACPLTRRTGALFGVTRCLRFKVWDLKLPRWLVQLSLFCSLGRQAALYLKRSAQTTKKLPEFSKFPKHFQISYSAAFPAADRVLGSFATLSSHESALDSSVTSTRSSSCDFTEFFRRWVRSSVFGVAHPSGTRNWAPDVLDVIDRSRRSVRKIISVPHLK